MGLRVQLQGAGAQEARVGALLLAEAMQPRQGDEVEALTQPSGGVRLEAGGARQQGEGGQVGSLGRRDTARYVGVWNTGLIRVHSCLD
jgi:hypothetical protein